MSDLSLGGGGFPAGWGMPSPLYNFETGQYENGGVVWHGYEGHEKCTLEDVNALKDYNPDVNIDMPTVFGGPSFFERKGGKYPYKQTIVL
jgi:hypothetical protein